MNEETCPHGKSFACTICGSVHRWAQTSCSNCRGTGERWRFTTIPAGGVKFTCPDCQGTGIDPSAKMRTPKAKAAARGLFKLSPAELGKAAVAGARVLPIVRFTTRDMVLFGIAISVISFFVFRG